MSISGRRVTLCGQVYHMQKLGHPFLSGLVRIALEKIPALAVASNWRDFRGVGRTTPNSMRGAIRSPRNTKPANEGGPASRQAGNISELGISDLRRVTPAILAARISRAIRFRPTEKPSALSWHEHAARHSPRCRLLPRVAGGVGLWAWSSMGEG